MKQVRSLSSPISAPTDFQLPWQGSSSAPTPYARTPLHLPLSPFLKHDPGEQRPSTLVVALAPSVFAHHLRRDILHACVVHHLDSLRQGTASTKTRGEVKASGRKLRPQKGSGRARLGDAASPMLRGGGVAFGPHPRDFSTKLPRKVREMGMRVVLSAKLRERMLNVVPRLDWEDGKTNSLSKRLKSVKWEDKTLFVTGVEIPSGLDRASRNIPDVDVIHADELTVYEALRWKRLVLDVDAVAYFAERLGKEGDALEDISPLITYPSANTSVAA